MVHWKGVEPLALGRVLIQVERQIVEKMLLQGERRRFDADEDHPPSQGRVVPRRQIYIVRRSWHLKAGTAGVDPSLGVMNPRHFRLTSSRLG